VNATKQTEHNGGFENVIFVIDDLQGALRDVVFNGL